MAQFVRAGGYLNSLSPPATPARANSSPPTEYSPEAMAEWQLGWDMAFHEEWRLQQQRGSDAYHLQEIHTRLDTPSNC